MEISVIIPTHNREDIVEEAIRAIHTQTLPQSNYEVTVVDDGSSDQTPSILIKLRKELSFTLIQSYQSYGPAHARNKGVSAAQSDLIVFIQDDIIAEKDFLEKHLKAHAVHPDRKTVIVGYTYWDKRIAQDPLMQYLAKGNQFDYDRLGELTDFVPADHLLFYTSNVSLHKSFLKQVGGFDENFRIAGTTAYEDTELSWRLHKAGMSIYVTKAAAAHYHKRTLTDLAKRRYAEGIMTHLLHKKHPDFSWYTDKGDFWYNLKNLKFGALLSRFRFLFALVTTIIFNPFVVWPLQLFARKKYVHNTLVYKIILGYHYNRGYWKGFWDKVFNKIR